MSERSRYDIYAEAEAVQQRLVDDGQASWAERLRETIATGSTGSEILLGLRRDVGTLTAAEDVHLSPDTRRLLTEFSAHIDEVDRHR